MFKHKCKFKAVSAKEEQNTGGFQQAIAGVQPMTYVLARCNCGFFMSYVLAGPFAPDINELIEVGKAGG